MNDMGKVVTDIKTESIERETAIHMGSHIKPPTSAQTNVISRTHGQHQLFACIIICIACIVIYSNTHLADSRFMKPSIILPLALSLGHAWANIKFIHAPLQCDVEKPYYTGCMDGQDCVEDGQ